MNWNDWIISNEVVIRLGFFFSIFAAVAFAETRYPRRPLTVSKRVRWFNNISLVVLNSVVLRFLFPTAAVGVALLAEQNNWGWLNNVDMPLVIATIIAVVIMDFVIYLQHVMMHSVPLFWRLHRVHHADLDYDVTTGSRFHTIEIVLSMLLKFATIVLLGPPLVAVIIFEVVLNAMAMFNHGNLRLPENVDRVLRLFVVTPDMHRVHHSVEDDETNSNFGFNIPWWDRIFGTYKAQPRHGHGGMTIGIHKFRDMKQVSRLDGLLILPFKGKVSDYAINRRSWSENHED